MGREKTREAESDGTKPLEGMSISLKIEAKRIWHGLDGVGPERYSGGDGLRVKRERFVINHGDRRQFKRRLGGKLEDEAGPLHKDEDRTPQTAPASWQEAKLLSFHTCNFNQVCSSLVNSLAQDEKRRPARQSQVRTGTTQTRTQGQNGHSLQSQPSSFS